MPGPDGFIEIGNDGNYRQSPITSQGRVAYNAFKDDDRIKIRKANSRAGRSFYQGPIEDVHVSIYPGDLCFAIRATEAMGMPRKKSYQTFVLSSLNQGFETGATLAEIRSYIKFVGVAGSSGARHDHRNNNPERDLALVIGGLQTLLNTGPMRINNGDYVYWDIPDPTIELGKGTGHNLDRYVLVTKPYRPGTDASFRAQIGKMITGEDSSSHADVSGLRESAEGMRALLATSMLAVFECLMSEGYLTTVQIGDMTKLTKTDRVNRVDVTSDEEKATALGTVSAAFGLSDSLSAPPPKGSMAETFIGCMVGSKGEGIPTTGGTKAVRTMAKLQKDFLNNLFLVVNQATDDVRSRIIGQALTPADPNGEYDMILGHYMA